MRELFLTVLSLSLSGSLVALALLALGPVWRHRLRKSWQYYIWLVVLLRLLIPVGPDSSLMGRLFARAPQAASVSAAVAEPAAEPAGEEAVSVSRRIIREEPAIPAAQAPQPPDEIPADRPSDRSNLAALIERSERTAPAPGPVTAPDQPRPGLIDRLWVVWLGGAALLLACKLLGYGLFVRRLARGLQPAEDAELSALYAAVAEQAGVRRPPPLCYSDAVSSPMLIGALRPRIILPVGGTGVGGMRCVLLHELTHYRRRDLWYKWLAQLTLCVHWFNPVVHLVARRIGSACELACDEAVIASMSLEQKFGYGDTLLATVRPGAPVMSSAGALSMSEDARLLKERLGSVLKHRQISRSARVFSLALTLVLLVGAAFAGVYAASAATPPDGGHTKAAQYGAAAGMRPATVERTETTVGSNSLTSSSDLSKHQTAQLPEMEATELTVTVDAAGLVLRPAEDGRFTYHYRSDVHTMKYSASDGAVTVAVVGKPDYRQNGFEDTSFYLYVPDQVWSKLRVEADASAVTMGALRGATELKVDACALTVTLPADHGNFRLNADSSAVTLYLSEEPGNLALTLRGSTSAVSLPSGFPGYRFQPTYTHTVGTGTVTMDLDLDACAFTLKVREDDGQAKSFRTGDGNTTKKIGTGGWSSLWDDIWKDSWSAAAGQAASTWEDTWREAWDEVNWKETWREAWDEANWKETWREAWDEANWEETWREAWDEANWEDTWREAWNEANWEATWNAAWKGALQELESELESTLADLEARFIIPRRLNLNQLGTADSAWIAACDKDPGVHLIYRDGRYLVYCNLIEENFSWSTNASNGAWDISLADSGKPLNDISWKGYALLEVPDGWKLTVRYGGDSYSILRDGSK